LEEYTASLSKITLSQIALSKYLTRSLEKWLRLNLIEGKAMMIPTTMSEVSRTVTNKTTTDQITFRDATFTRKLLAAPHGPFGWIKSAVEINIDLFYLFILLVSPCQ
jgi:hypothetical protein